MSDGCHVRDSACVDHNLIGAHDQGVHTPIRECRVCGLRMCGNCSVQMYSTRKLPISEQGMWCGECLIDRASAPDRPNGARQYVFRSLMRYVRKTHRLMGEDITTLESHDLAADLLAPQRLAVKCSTCDGAGFVTITK